VHAVLRLVLLQHLEGLPFALRAGLLNARVAAAHELGKGGRAEAFVLCGHRVRVAVELLEGVRLGRAQVLVQGKVELVRADDDEAAVHEIGAEEHGRQLDAHQRKNKALIGISLELDVSKHLLPLQSGNYGETCYDLVAFVTHIDGYGAGHYTATCRDAKGWRLCDDTEVTSTTLAETDLGSTYLFFYVRRGSGARAHAAAHGDANAAAIAAQAQAQAGAGTGAGAGEGAGAGAGLRS